MLASVSVDCHMVDLVGGLSNARVFSLLPESGLKGSQLHQLRGSAKETLGIVPGSCPSKVGNGLLDDVPEMHPEIVGSTFGTLPKKVIQVYT